jgi:RNA recognition motif-containing protein
MIRGEKKMNLKLYVGNLAFGASEEDLKKLFSEAGAVQSVKIVTDSYSGRSRGFGFVEMASKSEAEKAISLVNGKTFMDRTLIVSEARPQKKRGGEFKDRRNR